MTAGVKELTLRDNPRGDSGRPAPTLSARDLRTFLGVFSRIGYDAAALLDAVGLRQEDLDDLDGLVPSRAWPGVVAAASRLRPTPNLALRLAAETPMGAYPLLDYLVLSSDSVGEGYRQLARYFRLVSPCTIEIQAEEDPIRVTLSAGADRFGAEYTLPLSVFHLRRETEGRLRIESLCLVHRPDDIADFERRLGCPVHPEAGWNGVTLSRASWSLPLARRDPILRGILERQANEDAFHASSGGSISEVRRLILQRVSGGDTGIQSVARMLATTPRTLQRRLAAEGTSYQELLEEIRRQAAVGYLEDSDLSVSEIAYLLGYSEPAAFHRAFRRWDPKTPAEYRREHRGK